MDPVVLNRAAIAEYMRTPDGPVMRKLMVVADAVKVRTVASLKPGFPQDFLGPTIVKRTVMDADGPAVQVGSSKTHTRPHLIHGNPYLAFRGRTGDLVILGRRKRGDRPAIIGVVHHPGSNFDKYLTRKLKEALASVSGADI